MSKHDKLQEILLTWILSHMDVNNGRRCRSHLTSYLNGAMTIDYDPHKLWVFISTYHCSITKARLAVITSTLHGLRQDGSETLTAYLDKFNLVLNKYFKFGGELSDTQAAQLLINSVKSEYDTTVKMIYMTVKDLTIAKVSMTLLESEVHLGSWANSAVSQLSVAAVSTSSSSQSYGKRQKCTQ